MAYVGQTWRDDGLDIPTWSSRRFNTLAEAQAWVLSLPEARDERTLLKVYEVRRGHHDGEWEEVRDFCYDHVIQEWDTSDSSTNQA